MAKEKKYPRLFDAVTKIDKSTSSVDELRVPIFAPITQVTATSSIKKVFDTNNQVRTVKTSWGKAEIRNVLLTQTHKDILDCILTHAHNPVVLDKGGIALYFYLNDILKQYGAKGRNTNWLKEKLDDLADVRLKYFRTVGNDDDFSDFHIFAKSSYSSKEKMYCVILDQTYVKLYETGLSLNYEAMLPQLLNLKSPILKAICRFFFTHRSSSLTLVQVLETIGYSEQSVRSMQLIKKELRESIQPLLELGIVYDPKELMFKYSGNKDVLIYYPPYEKNE
jgi:hypothetical protein